MTTKYLVLKPNQHKDFSSDVLYGIARQLEEVFLVPFAEIVETLKSPHMKHFVKIVEDTLRSKFDNDLNIKFDFEKAEKGAIAEMYIDPGSDLNSRIDLLLVDCAKFFKANASKFEEKNRFESYVCRQLSELVGAFKSTLADPERFNIYKKQWQHDFNKNRLKHSSKKMAVISA
jgi:hypothetical protein